MSPPPSTVFVGRDQELAVGRQLVEGARGGTSGTLLIEGEAGIGKTELVQRIAADAADRGLSVLRGGAHPFERNRPFGVLAEALDLRPRSADPRHAALGRSLVGDDAVAGAAPAPPTDARYRIVEEIIDLVETSCSKCPVLLVLEDLHWADESSIAVFASMVRRLSHVPLLLIGALRPVPRTPELDLVLDDCMAGGARLLRLGSLTADQVDSLVEDQLGARPGPVLASIVSKAGGNPLWVVELVRSLSTEGWLRRDAGSVEAVGEELPSSLRELVLRRLAYLPGAALDLLQITSVLGEAVSTQDLAAVTDRPIIDIVTDLDEAFRARLLDAREDTIAFRDQLVQQAIYEELPGPTRRALHRAAAGAYARAGAELSKVASQLLRGADPGDLEAVRWLRQAAAEASAGAPGVAVGLLRRAEALLPTGDPDADVIAAELAEALLNAGNVAEAAVVAEGVLDRPHRDEADVPLRLTLVSALSLMNRAMELVDRSEAALTTSTLQLPDQALVLTQASYGRTFSGDLAGGEATARRALEVAERAAHAAMAVWSRCALSVAVKTQGRYAEALAHTREAVARASDPFGIEARLRHPHFFLAMALADSDLIDEARGAYVRAIDEAEHFGTAWLLPDMLLLSAEARFLVGDWADASAEFESGLELAERHGQRISIAQTRAYQAVMAAGRGDLTTARATLAEVEAELTSDSPVYGAELVAFAASVIAEAEENSAWAYEVLLRFWNHDIDRDIRYYHRYLGPPLVRLALGSGYDDVARHVVATLDEGAALAPEVGTVRSAALRCRGVLGRDSDASLEAVELARRGPRLLDRAGACEDAASVLAAAGRTEDAKELLLEAQTVYEGLNASAWVARTAAALRRLGVRRGVRGPRRRAETGWASLTPSERAVSDLVAQGLTNREMGRRLHISPHTVNTHLRHVFQKLALSTRAELAAKVVSHGQLTHSGDVFSSVEGDPDG